MAHHRAADINSLDPDRPMLFEIGRDVSLSEFIRLNDEALTQCGITKSMAQAKIRKPGFFFGKVAEKKNAKLKTIIDELAPARAASVRDALQTGARLAFIKGYPQKIQAMMADPARFMSPNKEWLHGEVTYKAEHLIYLLYKSKNPDTVPLRALAKVSAVDKQATLQYTLFRLVSFYHHVGPLAFSLLKSGAKADGVILAEAVRSNATSALVEQLLQRGATYAAAFDVIKGNPDYFKDTAQKLERIRETLAQKASAIAAQPPKFRV